MSLQIVLLNFFLVLSDLTHLFSTPTLFEQCSGFVRTSLFFIPERKESGDGRTDRLTGTIFEVPYGRFSVPYNDSSKKPGCFPLEYAFPHRLQVRFQRDMLL